MHPIQRPADAKPVSSQRFRKARLAWNSYIGPATSQRNVLVGVTAASLALAFYGLYDARQARRENPLRIMVVDRDPTTMITHGSWRPTDPSAPTPAQARKRLEAWIVNARSVTVDAIALGDRINAAYNTTRKDSPAHRALLAFHRAEPPVESAAKWTRQPYRVSALSVSGESGKTWEVTWCESRTGRDGVLQSVEHWRATASYMLEPSTDEETGRKNPDGWYVEDIDWRQIRDGATRQQMTGANRSIQIPVACQ
jgi:type IV secretory pathway TrbF-like protein